MNQSVNQSINQKSINQLIKLFQTPSLITIFWKFIVVMVIVMMTTNDGWVDKFGCWNNFSDTNCRFPQRSRCHTGEKSATVAKISEENFDHIVSLPFSLYKLEEFCKFPDSPSLPPYCRSLPLVFSAADNCELTRQGNARQPQMS